jgi:predicted RNA-binding protein
MTDTEHTQMHDMIIDKLNEGFGRQDVRLRDLTAEVRMINGRLVDAHIMLGKHQIVLETQALVLDTVRERSHTTANDVQKTAIAVAEVARLESRVESLTASLQERVISVKQVRLVLITIAGTAGTIEFVRKLIQWVG